jgi:glutamate racemase
VAEEYLAPLKAAGVDTVVLGCTHYPLLTGVISYVMGADVTLVSSAEETAKDVYRALATHDLQRMETSPPEHHFVATGDAAQFEALARRFLGPEVLSVRHVDHVAAQYPTGSLARITPEMIAAAQRAGARPRISNFVGSSVAGGQGQ